MSSKKLDKKEEKRLLKEKIKELKINMSNELVPLKEERLKAISSKDKSREQEILKEEEKIINEYALLIKEEKRKFRKKFPVNLKFLLPTFLVLMIGLFIFNLGMAFSRSGQYDDYNDFKQYTVTSNNMFSTNKWGSDYYVYIYKDGCSACASIKTDIFAYIKSDHKTPLYIYNFSEEAKMKTGEKIDVNGATSFEELTIAATPTLLRITGGKVVYYAEGGTSVLAVLNPS